MKLVFIGMGQVGRSVLELLPVCKLLPPKIYENIFIIEPRKLPKLNLFKPYPSINHLRITLAPDNIKEVLNKVLKKGDIVCDVSVNVDALLIMKYCYRIGCIYINTSMEDWSNENSEIIDRRPQKLYERSLYYRVLTGKKLFGKKDKPSMLADMGMNPGIISCFAMQAIEDFANSSLDNKKALALVKKKKFAEAARALNIRVIHITENDTQTTYRKKPKGIFWNTWSSKGLLEESLDPVQIGLGTHDNSKFPQGSIIPSEGPGNVCIMPIRGMDCNLWSMTPSRTSNNFKSFVGCSIPHGEANTISNALTVLDSFGNPIYRPSVFFVYKPCPVARESLNEIRKSKYSSIPKTFHTLTLGQIRGGYDAIGVLLITSDSRGWWCGTVLDKMDMKKIGMKYTGPTTIQVAISMISSLKWLLENPEQGFITPENLPYKRILRESIPYLGKIISAPVKMPKRKKIIYDTYKI